MTERQRRRYDVEMGNHLQTAAEWDAKIISARYARDVQEYGVEIAARLEELAYARRDGIDCWYLVEQLEAMGVVNP